MVKRVVTVEEEETMQLAARLARTAKGGEIICLNGRMGAGKTAFARGFVRALGEAASSPSFLIVQEYPTRPPVCHFDLYRLNAATEMYEIGFEEYMNGENILVIEWANGLELPGDRLEVNIEDLDETRRELALCARGPVHEAWIRKAGI